MGFFDKLTAQWSYQMTLHLRADVHLPSEAILSLAHAEAARSNGVALGERARESIWNGTMSDKNGSSEFELSIANPLEIGS